jgi:peptidoglycan/xylan/chitin deacetylase (PgdA/CDA1 family)
MKTSLLPPACLWLLTALAPLAVRAAEPVPEKLVVLTFDDAVESHHSVVRPLLKRYGFSATFFITEGFSFLTNKKDHLSWEQIAELQRDGFEIGNHTRDHLGVSRESLPRLEEQVEAIGRRCVEHGIPRPVSFAYPGNAITPEAIPILERLGIRFARRGGAPEYSYDGGRGVAFEPGADHPLLIPSAGDARPFWSLDDFRQAVEQARGGRIAVLQFHGVPDREHPWVHTPPERFEEYMKYLKDQGYRAIALRDLDRYLSPGAAPADPLAVIERRKAMGAETRVECEVVDAASGRAVPCRVYLQGQDSTWHFASPASGQGSAVRYQRRNRMDAASVEMHTTLSAHPFSFEVPPGRYRLTVERGKEWLPRTREVPVGREPVKLRIELRRWVDMASRAWFSGDTHVHRPLSELPNLLLAEDLNVALPLTAWVTRAFVPPAQGDKNTESAAGDLIAVDGTHVIWPRNTEYELFSVGERRHTLGAVFVLGHQSPLDRGAPPVKPIAEQSRREGALLDLDKHDWPWAPALVPLMGVDLFELANNHHWRAAFAMTTWASPTPVPAWMQPPAGGLKGNELDWTRYTFNTYYTLLDCGFRLRPAAGTASGVHPVPLGFGRVYVRLPEGFSYQGWWKGLDAGRSFVTTGPMLLVQVEGRDPGHRFTPESGAAVEARVSGEVLSERPIESVEVVVNGEVVRRIEPHPVKGEEGASAARFEERIGLAGSSWIALRCWEPREGGRYRFAHTGPWYFDLPGRPLRPRRREVEFLVQRVKDEVERSRAVLPAEALAEYAEALRTYEALLGSTRP